MRVAQQKGAAPTHLCYVYTMAVHGSLLTMPLADLLQWVATKSRSGTLSVQREGREWELEFDQGRVTAYNGPEIRENLGYIVIASGLVDETTLRGAYQQQRIQGTPLMNVLLLERLVDQQQLSTCLSELVIESIYDLFIDLPGEFVYAERSAAAFAVDGLEDDVPRFPIALDIGMLIAEGSRRHDEWEEVRKRFPADDVPVRIVDEKLPAFDTLGLRERRILTGIRGGHKISDICFEMHTPIPAVLCIIARLESQGILEIIGGDDADSADQRSRVDKLVAQATLLRGAGQCDEAAALLEVAVRMRPDVDSAREALKDTLGEQIKAMYDLLPPVKVPVLVAPAEKLARLRLRPEERFLLDRLSAQMDIGSLIMVSSLNERETLKVLKKLLHSGLIELR